MMVEMDKIVHSISFIQLRGSIPLFWSQSATSLRPVPVLSKHEDDNMVAMSKHFARISHTYKPIVVVNLVVTLFSN